MSTSWFKLRGYGTSGEYMRELIRQDQDKRQFKAHLLVGMRSGVGGGRWMPVFCPLAPKRVSPQARLKPILRSPQARADIEDALVYHVQEAPHMADAFLDALEKAVTHIQRAPGTGSPRHVQELGLPGLRFWGLSKFPFSLFYIEQAGQLWVIRLVHMSRDIPASLQD